MLDGDFVISSRLHQATDMDCHIPVLSYSQIELTHS